MNRRLQFGTAIAAAIVIAAIGSHWLADWAKIKTETGQPWTWGNPDAKTVAFMAGSSVADYGISWDLISTQLELEVKGWGVAGGSPVEWEQFQSRLPEARTTFVVVCAADLDEALMCDFRAALVPLGQSVKTLARAHVDIDYWKSSLHQYPTTWLRTLFPTLGRSRGLMGRIRIQIVKLIKPSAHISESEAGPTFGFGKNNEDDEYKRQRMSEWSESKIIGKLVAMRVGFRGCQSFNGPKRVALERMLRFASEKGRTIFIVMPVSPAYTKEFMSPVLAKEFEDALASLRQAVPTAEYLRLDQLPGLASADNFCDLAHMNVFGQKIATRAFLDWLNRSGH
jgi:hypothetical protein